MNGSRRLTWVTALTVASLLLGGGALNVLAEGHGGGDGDHGGGGGQGKSEHQQVQQPVVVNQATHDGESHAVQQASPVQATNGEKHEDEHNNVQQHEDENNNVQKHEDDDNNVQKHEDENENLVAPPANVQRVDDDDEDLVTPPARVTDEDRPGLGCGDDNHRHTGAPGNPGLTCKAPEAGDDDQVLDTDDASPAVTVAGATAVGEDLDGDW